MSARAIASQKAKRAGGPSGGVTEISQIANSTATTNRITIPQAIHILEKKLLEIDSNMKESAVQNELLNGFAQHLNDLKQFKSDSEVKIQQLEKENSNLKIKISQLEEFVPSIRGSLMSIESKIKLYDEKIENISELQKLVNTMSTRLMNKE